MGNKCSTKTQNPFYDDSDLNDYDRAIFNLKREKVFYGTIAICFLYGSFALLLFVLSYFSDKIKYLLLNSFLPFTIVYVIGTILIIMYLIHQVLNFKPYKINNSGNYDDLSCPDYWTLQRVYDTTDSNLSYWYNSHGFESNVVTPNLFNYRCVLNKNIFNPYDIFKASSNYEGGIYTGKYNFFNVASNSGISARDCNSDILSERGLYNNYNGRSGINYYPNELYANIYYGSNDYPNSSITQYNDIDTNIFKKKDTLKLKYELARAALLMNNYKIANFTNIQAADSAAYTDFYKPYTLSSYDSDSSQDGIKTSLNKLGITLLNFDADTTAGGHNRIDDKIIRVFKNNGKAIVCNRPADLNNKGVSGTGITCSDTEDAAAASADVLKNIPLNCEKIYPMYLASVDNNINKTDRNMDNNLIRCAYSKICGIPWSDMNCDKYNTSS